MSKLRQLAKGSWLVDITLPDGRRTRRRFPAQANVAARAFMASMEGYKSKKRIEEIVADFQQTG